MLFWVAHWTSSFAPRCGARNEEAGDWEIRHNLVVSWCPEAMTTMTIGSYEAMKSHLVFFHCLSTSTFNDDLGGWFRRIHEIFCQIWIMGFLRDHLVIWPWKKSTYNRIVYWDYYDITVKSLKTLPKVDVVQSWVAKKTCNGNPF